MTRSEDVFDLRLNFLIHGLRTLTKAKLGRRHTTRNFISKLFYFYDVFFLVHRAFPSGSLLLLGDLPHDGLFTSVQLADGLSLILLGIVLIIDLDCAMLTFFRQRLVEGLEFPRSSVGMVPRRASCLKHWGLETLYDELRGPLEATAVL